MTGASESAVAPPRISVRNLQRSVFVGIVGLERFAAKALRYCLRVHKRKHTNLTRLCEVFVWLISDRRMAVLHRRFLKKGGPTDVLTFQHGEIFVSVDTAQRNARTFGSSLARELRLYIVHGLLHLHGFDDRTKSEAHKMEEAQEKILRQLADD
jgi:probable rRNA maturation factor